MKTEEEVAVKVTSLSELINIRNELALQKTCCHPNIVHVGDCFDWKDKLWIVMEYMEKGSLTGIVGKDISLASHKIQLILLYSSSIFLPVVGSIDLTYIILPSSH